MIRRLPALGAAAVLALGLSACSSSDDTAENSAAYCNSVAKAQSEVAALKSLLTSDGTTVGDLREQRDAVGEAADQAAKDGESLADSVKADIAAADEAFDKAISDIPGDASLSEAAEAYRAAVDAWDTQVAQIRSEVGCG